MSITLREKALNNCRNWGQLYSIALRWKPLPRPTMDAGPSLSGGSFSFCIIQMLRQRGIWCRLGQLHIARAEPTKCVSGNSASSSFHSRETSSAKSNRTLKLAARITEDNHGIPFSGRHTVHHRRDVRWSEVVFTVEHRARFGSRYRVQNHPGTLTPKCQLRELIGSLQSSLDPLHQLRAGQLVRVDPVIAQRLPEHLPIQTSSPAHPAWA